VKALVYHGPGDIRCDDVADPSPAATDGVIVQIEATAICGSDLHNYHGQMGPDTGYSIGHECIGTIVETGSGVQKLGVGDRVIVPGLVGCGNCDPCRAGAVNACVLGNSPVFGNNMGLGGAQAEALAVPRADFALRPIADGISAEQAVLLTDILPTGYYGALGANIHPGDDVAVIGAGPVGIMAILSAHVLGAARVFVIDSVPERLAMAAAVGAIPCDLDGGGAELVRQATSGLGPHSVIEAVGADETIQTALWLARQGGAVSVVGVNMNMEFPFPMGIAMARSLTFRIGICPVPQLWPALVPLVAAGTIAPEIVFTHRMGLSEGSAAYQMFDARTDGVMKILLDPRH
jgi:2-desacetyl-2-hydroxyethyl bacteriochlorophyllide A dehydrogenase